jgi:hypothetical protein
MSTSVKFALTCALVASGAGCSRLRPLAMESDATGAPMHGAVIPVEIRNDNMQAVNIYILHGGLRTRIGIADAAQASSFFFPASYSEGAARVQLVAVPLIGGRFGWRKSIQSEPIVVHVGERVIFSLESDLARSTIAVYTMDTATPADSAPRDSTPPPMRSSAIVESVSARGFGHR